MRYLKSDLYLGRNLAFFKITDILRYNSSTGGPCFLIIVKENISKVLELHHVVLTIKMQITNCVLLTYKAPPTTERYQGGLSALTRIAILLSNQPVWILFSLYSDA
jgi:hypothetical protein